MSQPNPCSLGRAGPAPNQSDSQQPLHRPGPPAVHNPDVSDVKKENEYVKSFVYEGRELPVISYVHDQPVEWIGDRLRLSWILVHAARSPFADVKQLMGITREILRPWKALNVGTEEEKELREIVPESREQYMAAIQHILVAKDNLVACDACANSNLGPYAECVAHFDYANAACTSCQAREDPAGCSFHPDYVSPPASQD